MGPIMSETGSAQKGGAGAEGRGQRKEGGEVDDFPEGRERQRQLDLGHAGEAVHYGVLHAEGNDGEGADPDGRERLGGEVGLAGEEAHEEPAREPREGEHYGRVAHAQERYVLLRLEYAVAPVRAEVEGEDGLRPARDAAERHGHDQHEALRDGGAGYEPVAELRPSVALQHGVHGDYHDAVHKDNEEGRDAGDEYAPHEPEAVTPEAYAHRHGLAKEDAEDIYAACELGEHRGDGRARDAHVEDEDEERVEHDVERRAEHDGEHALLGKALADDELVHAEGEQVEGRTAEVDGKILLRVGIGRLARAEEHEHWPLEREHRGGEHDGADAEDEETVGEYAPRLVLPARAHVDAHERRAADADEKGEGPEHGHDRPADADACQRCLARHGDVAYVYPVHDGVEHADKLRQHAGERDATHQRPYRVPAKVVLLSQGSALPENSARHIII